MQSLLSVSSTILADTYCVCIIKRKMFCICNMSYFLCSLKVLISTVNTAGRERERERERERNIQTGFQSFSYNVITLFYGYHTINSPEWPWSPIRFMCQNFRFLLFFLDLSIYSIFSFGMLG